MKYKKTLNKTKAEEEVFNGLIKYKSKDEDNEVIRIFIKGLEGGLKIERECYEKSKLCMEHLRTIHDGVLEMKEIASKVLNAWNLTKDDSDFNPDSFPGGRAGMQKAMFYPMETFDKTMPKIAKVFDYDEEEFLAPYVQNIRDITDAICFFKKYLDIDALIVEVEKAEVGRRKAIFRKIFRAYKEYIGIAPGILHTKFKSINVPKEKTDIIYEFIKFQVERAKEIVECLRLVI